MAPDGKTIYLYTASASDGGSLYKSSDAGLTWTSTGIGVGIDLIYYGNPITKIIVNQNNANELLATNGVNVYRSNNAWHQLVR